MNNLSEIDEKNNSEINWKEFFSPVNIVIFSIFGVIVLFMAIGSRTGDVPNVIEENVETAIEELHDENFSNIIVETNTDQNHTDSWIVCAQDPKSPMEMNKKEEITLYVAENCKSMDSEGNIVEVVETMPDIIGETLSGAKIIINDSIDFHELDIIENDATGSGRSVWDEDNWVVCNQSIEPEYEITSNSDLQLDYARDADECEGKTEPVESTSKVETTSEGLTESAASMKCDDWIGHHHPDLKIRWIAGVRSIDIVNMYDHVGDMWQFSVDVKKSGDTVGTLICRVGGTNESPILVESFINS